MAGFTLYTMVLKGFRDIAGRVHTYAVSVAKSLEKLGYTQSNKVFFDTLYITGLSKEEQEKIRQIALEVRVNFQALRMVASVSL